MHANFQSKSRIQHSAHVLLLLCDSIDESP